MFVSDVCMELAIVKSHKLGPVQIKLNHIMTHLWFGSPKSDNFGDSSECIGTVRNLES